MSQTGFGQLDQGLRITGFTTACLLFVLAGTVFNFSSIVVLLAICGLALAILLPPAMPWIADRLRDFDLFSPYVAFPAAYIIWFVAGSINVIEVPAGLEDSPFDPIPYWMYGVYALGLAGYFCGLYIGRRFANNRPQRTRREISFVKMQRIVRLTFFATLVLWGLTVSQFSLPILNPSTAGEARLAFHGPIFLSFMCLNWTTFILSPAFIWVRGGKQRCDWFWVVGVPFILTLLLFSLGGRSWVSTPLLTLIIAMSYLKHRVGWKMVVAVVLIFCIFSLFGYIRDNAFANQYLVDIGLPAPLIPFVYAALDTRYSVDALRRIIETIPSQVPYQYGALTLMPLRTFLPGHQELSDIFFKKLLGREFQGAGLPATVLAPLYADLGWIGIFFGMILYGILLSWTFQRARAHSHVIDVIFYAWWLQSCITGVFSDGLMDVVVFILPIFWIMLFMSARMKLSPQQITSHQATPS
jgi:oligosaccharide repeat unit polymerase